jgi:hypothetical protein
VTGIVTLTRVPGPGVGPTSDEVPETAETGTVTCIESTVAGASSATNGPLSEPAVPSGMFGVVGAVPVMLAGAFTARSEPCWPLPALPPTATASGSPTVPVVCPDELNVPFVGAATVISGPPELEPEPPEEPELPLVEPEEPELPEELELPEESELPLVPLVELPELFEAPGEPELPLVPLVEPPELFEAPEELPEFAVDPEPGAAVAVPPPADAVVAEGVPFVTQLFDCADAVRAPAASNPPTTTTTPTPTATANRAREDNVRMKVFSLFRFSELVT